MPAKKPNVIEQHFEKGVLAQDPFVSIDREGVGELVQIATERGRSLHITYSSLDCGSRSVESR